MPLTDSMSVSGDTQRQWETHTSLCTDVRGGTQKRAATPSHLVTECTLWYGLPWKQQWHTPLLLLAGRASSETPFAQGWTDGSDHRAVWVKSPAAFNHELFKKHIMSYSESNDFFKEVSQVFPIGLRRQIAHTVSSYSPGIWFMDTLGPVKWNDTNPLRGGLRGRVNPWCTTIWWEAFNCFKK